MLCSFSCRWHAWKWSVLHISTQYFIVHGMFVWIDVCWWLFFTLQTRDIGPTIYTNWLSVGKKNYCDSMSLQEWQNFSVFPCQGDSATLNNSVVLQGSWTPNSVTSLWFLGTSPHRKLPMKISLYSLLSFLLLIPLTFFFQHFSAFFSVCSVLLFLFFLLQWFDGFVCSTGVSTLTYENVRAVLNHALLHRICWY